jgi:hypothetical protein
MEEIDRYSQCNSTMSNVLKMISKDIGGAEYYKCATEAQTSVNRLKSYIIADILLRGISLLYSGKSSDIYMTATTKPAIIKTSSRDLTQEIHMGLFHVNKLLKYISNFAETYGYIRCGPIYKAQQPLGWMLPLSKIHLVTEYTYGDRFIDRIHKLSVKEYLSIMLQLICAVKSAFTYTGFLHNKINLHTIMIRDNTEEMEVLYPDSDVKMKSTIMPILVDYSQSLINKNVSPVYDLVKLIDEIISVAPSHIAEVTRIISSGDIIENIISYSKNNNIDIGIISRDDFSLPPNTPSLNNKLLPRASSLDYTMKFETIYLTDSIHKVKEERLKKIVAREMRSTFTRIAKLESNVKTSNNTTVLLSNAIRIFIKLKYINTFNVEHVPSIDKSHLDNVLSIIYDLMKNIDIDKFYN